MTRVYVAGPFRAQTPFGVEESVRRAERLTLEVCRLGAVGVCPHTMWRHFQDSLPDAFWLRAGIDLLDCCDAVVLVEGWERSTGTVAEIEHARLHGLPVFKTVGELGAWLNEVRA